MTTKIESMRLSKALAAQGYTLTRFVSRIAYARNGNTHNPTITYTWTLWQFGKQIGGGSTRRSAVELAYPIE